MVNSTQTLEEMTAKIVLEVPVVMISRRQRSFSATTGSSPSDYEERFVEYFVPDKKWTQDNVEIGFKGNIQQYYNREQYNALLNQRQEHKSAYGRISIELKPLADIQRDRINSSVDNLIQTIILDVPVHLNHDEVHSIDAGGNKIDRDIYSVEFSIHDHYQYSHPKISKTLPSFVNLFVSAEQYSQLVEQRKKQKDGYGRIAIKLEVLAK